MLKLLYDSKASTEKRRMILGGTWGDGNKYTNRMKYWDAIAPRTRYTYEAITTSPAITMPKPGKAQLYIGKFEDEEGQRLKGGNNYYMIRINKDVPANLFWSIVIYDADTRCIIDNRKGAAGGGHQTSASDIALLTKFGRESRSRKKYEKGNNRGEHDERTNRKQNTKRAA